MKALAFLPEDKIEDASKELLSKFKSIEASHILNWFMRRYDIKPYNLLL